MFYFSSKFLSLIKSLFIVRAGLRKMQSESLYLTFVIINGSIGSLLLFRKCSVILTGGVSVLFGVGSSEVRRLILFVKKSNSCYKAPRWNWLSFQNKITVLKIYHFLFLLSWVYTQQLVVNMLHYLHAFGVYI